MLPCKNIKRSGYQMTKAILFLFLLSLISCGSKNEKRCFSREEAILSCQAHEIANKQVDAPTAKLLCDPYFSTALNCYNL
jgi:hypothetical protein